MRLSLLKNIMRVTMIGAGYVGLVSGACFAAFGHNFTCVDKDPERIEALRRGIIPIYGPDLSDLVATNGHPARVDHCSDAGEGHKTVRDPLRPHLPMDAIHGAHCAAESASRSKLLIADPGQWLRRIGPLA